MGYNASRQTLYAVLMSVEEDLRSFITDHLCDEGCTPRELLGGAWEKCCERMVTEVGACDGASLEDLLCYLDYADSFQILNSQSQRLPRQLAKYIRDITPNLTSLTAVRNRVAHTKPLNFDDLANTLDVVEALSRSTEVNWTNLRSVLQRLKDSPEFVLGLTIPTDASNRTDKRHNLPAPDFDETGFLGRGQQVQDVVGLCLGPYPVVTISGEGGIGKTALALKVAYEILDLSPCPFDAVVWASSKTTTLTPQEVVRIQGAISDSLGLFKKVAGQLSGVETQDPLTEVLAYLEQFRILLILDNLETVLDDNIMNFLQRLPRDSKVLITSRIGLSALSYPYRLPPLQSGESIQLLRALAKVRGVNEQLRIPNNSLKAYCERMNNNPGWIKWFVSAMAAGKRPEEIIEAPGVFLDFCMSNVYEYLSHEARRVLRCMLSVPGNHSQAELSFLTRMDAVDLQRCLQILLTTNFVSMATRSVETSIESRYGISEMARSFLLKHHPVSPDENAEFTMRKRQIIAAAEQVRVGQNADPFSSRTVATRSSNDFIVARHLLNAIAELDEGRFSEAETEIAKALALAPNYFEVHRVDAMLQAKRNNHPAAREAYERAIEYEPKSAPLRYRYGKFLLRANSLDEAYSQLSAGLQIAPDSLELRLAMIRVLLYTGDFDAAKSHLDAAERELHRMPERLGPRYYDLRLGWHYRFAEFQIASERSADALGLLERLRATYEEVPASVRDTKMAATVGKSLITAERCRTKLDDPDDKLRACELIRWIFETAGDHVSKRRRGQLSSNLVKGTITAVKPTYGFAITDDGGTVFFHRAELLNPQDWPSLCSGTRVKFRVGVDERERKFGAEVELER